jgi:hypothetical protein
MAFELYKKDTVSFDIEGDTIELEVSRLTATEALQMNARVSRIDPKLSPTDAHEQMVMIYLELLVAIVIKIKGVNGIDEWPEDRGERKSLLDLCGFDFVLAAAMAYIASSNVEEDEEGK